MLRLLIQAVLFLPALAAAGVLPMLFVSVPELLADGNWQGAVFNGLALPGFLALAASIVLPQAWQLRTGARLSLVVGLVAAGAACVTLALIMVAGPGGRLRLPEAPEQFALAGGPLIVVVWNLRRLAGGLFAILATACGLLLLLSVLSLAMFGGCTRDPSAVRGEHLACL